ncbi:bifunctional riboflavin kinase/FAD synthetase [Eubacterium sp. MSJ-33]|uniref:bifunctional riboflavin kinase/FAD synthetase n=1 Tax=Eubacterium sp. MSJ-33 TaxID=2841528 RepID=UPI001C74DCD1|nr:bifunctional riboflavin kinase/FAD synthetase [Eubacterium sp. MSJ-33]QWT53478.1 bifunctional riboflavin kinase/FAD synthetase [Eubacterium sp. MSJ-33]
MKKLAYNDVNIADTVVALGKFEGLHKGHMLLINKVLQLSHETGKQSVVFSIDMPGTKRIYTIPERNRILEEIGIDFNITCEFTKKFASMKPEAFVKDVLVERLHPEYVVVGNDFRFGKNRQGDVALLEELGNRYGYEVLAFEKLREQGTVISSSYIREQIEQGNVDLIQEYMGRPYSIAGIVQYGKQLGTTIGFPTANLIPDEEKLLVPNGVYETSLILDNLRYRGITNVGDNPTVDDDHKIKVETNILDYNGNLYGKYLKIEFIRQIRKEIKFDSIEALKNQIKSDILEVAHQ